MFKWLKKLFCKHDLEIKVSMATDNVVGEQEIKCKKCGKIKEEWLYGHYRIFNWVHIDSSNILDKIFKRKTLKFLNEEQWK